MNKVEIDEKSGFCFGVVNAIKKAEEEVVRANRELSIVRFRPPRTPSLDKAELDAAIESLKFAEKKLMMLKTPKVSRKPFQTKL